MPLQSIKIDVEEKFPLLARAPITEAVVGINSRTNALFGEATVMAGLKSKLPEYPKQEARKNKQATILIGPDEQPTSTVKDLGFAGVQVTSEDGKHIALFGKDLFAFSRLQPYESWEIFQSEAMRLWQVYCSFGTRTEVQRLGLRFINQIHVPSSRFEVGDYLVTVPKDLPDLPLSSVGFFHHDTLSVPGYPYNVNVIRTVQPSTTGAILIFDIDVFRGPFSLPDLDLEISLAEMRWLKNKLFFGSITDKALSLFQ
jgi:uncharacterized protein (TIGR04255 family)